MTRKMWIENEGAFYHVIFFSNSREFIFYLLSFSLTPISPISPKMREIYIE